MRVYRVGVGGVLYYAFCVVGVLVLSPLLLVQGSRVPLVFLPLAYFVWRTAVRPAYRITVSDDGTVELRSLLRSQTVRVTEHLNPDLDVLV